jgi:hypothetical protein
MYVFFFVCGLLATESTQRLLRPLLTCANCNGTVSWATMADFLSTCALRSLQPIAPKCNFSLYHVLELYQEEDEEGEHTQRGREKWESERVYGVGV